MNAALGTLAVFAFVVGLWLFFHKDAPKTTTLFFTIAGVAVAAGLVGQFAAALIRSLLGLATTTTGQLVGVSASALASAIALVLFLEVVIKGMWFKRAKPKRYHPWLGLIMPTIVVGTGLPVVTTILTEFTRLASTVGSQL